jgi:4-hydroxythreonine-4-phosphate dehydrogenase
VTSRPRVPALTIVADDLSGAADCAVVCAARGLSAVVALTPGGPGRDADVWSVDGDTRAMSGEAAAAAVEALACASESGLLFKKLDSTLRGHVGAELAAILRARRRARPDAVAILAPAFPALGRTTVEGRQRLHGEPLEASEIWRREGRGGNASLIDMTRAHGLAAALLPLRGGAATMGELAAGADVLVCDAETDADLAAIARASLGLGRAAIWAGSAGLAGWLVEAAGLARPARPTPLPAVSGSRLLVVGSRSSVARRQAAVVAAMAGVVSIATDPTASREALVASGAAAALAGALEAGRDVIVWQPDLADEAASGDPRRCAGLASLLAERSQSIGALLATGGDTARRLLEALGVEALELVEELEPGAPLSLAFGRRRFPVITKAGAFGDEATLANCLSRLRALPVMPAAANEAGRITT